jgi:hypothetical protein
MATYVEKFVKFIKALPILCILIHQSHRLKKIRQLLYVSILVSLVPSKANHELS